MFGNGPWITPPTITQNEDSPQVTITEGVVSFTEGETAFADLDENSTIDDYMVVSHYEKDRRTWMMPLTSPGLIQGDTVAFCATSRPTLLWVVDWTVMTTGRKPIAPARTSNSRFVWLDEWLEPVQIGIAADGNTPKYRLSGTYFYGCRNPANELRDDVSFPLPPFLQDVFARTLNSSDFVQNITNTEQQQGDLTGFVVKGG